MPTSCPRLAWIRRYACIDAFPLRPAFVIDAFEELVAVWPLTAPLADLDLAGKLRWRLAETLGANTAPVALAIPSQAMGAGHEIRFDADSPAASLPLPGSIVRGRGSPPPVASFAAVAPENVYTVSKIEAALGGREERTP